MWDVQLLKVTPIPILTKKQIDRLWCRVKQNGPDDCWPFLGRVCEDGYGKISLNYKEFVASRLIYAVVHKLDPGQKIVCHTCDNPPCCNPKHLFLGTFQQNVKDSVAKKRHSSLIKGSAKVQALVNEEIVKEMRLSFLSKQELAEKYNIGISNVYRILTKRSWKHV